MSLASRLIAGMAGPGPLKLMEKGLDQLPLGFTIHMFDQGQLQCIHDSSLYSQAGPDVNGS